MADALSQAPREDEGGEARFSGGAGAAPRSRGDEGAGPERSRPRPPASSLGIKGGDYPPPGSRPSLRRLMGLASRVARGLLSPSLEPEPATGKAPRAAGPAAIHGLRRLLAMDSWSPIDQLMLVYTGTLAGLSLGLHPRRRRFRKLAASHLAVAGGVIAMASLHRSRGGAVLPFLRQTYPLLLLGPMHYWSGELALLVFPRFLDREVVRLDRRLFRKDLYVWLPRRFDGALCREAMNAAYFSFYPMIAGVALATWLKRRPNMAEATFTFSLCMYGHFLFFALVPVIGPTHLRRRLFKRPKLLFESLVSTAVERGDNDGGAIPSSHVAGAIVLTSIAGRLFGPRARRRLGILTGLLSVSTVYVSMHYPIDVVAGVATGLGAAQLGPRLFRRCSERAYSPLMFEQAEAPAPRLSAARPVGSSPAPPR